MKVKSYWLIHKHLKTLIVGANRFKDQKNLFKINNKITRFFYYLNLRETFYNSNLNRQI
jgi:hypothetical protein